MTSYNVNFLLQEDVMLWERFHGDPNVSDIDHKDNTIVNLIFFAGVVVTLMVVAGLLMYAIL